MKNFKKDLACNIALICVLAFSLIHLVLLTLNLFRVFNLALPKNFSYIFAYVLLILSFGLYVLEFLISKLKNLQIPSWMKIMFYIAFFIFTNVYYITGFYFNMFFCIVFLAYISVLISLVALSIYFNTHKDEKNALKVSTKELVLNFSVYSTALGSLAIFLISIIKLIFFKNYIFSNLFMVFVEFLIMLIEIVLMAIILGLSHKKSKIIVNNCLIKVLKESPSYSIKKEK